MKLKNAKSRENPPFFSIALKKGGLILSLFPDKHLCPIVTVFVISDADMCIVMV